MKLFSDENEPNERLKKMLGYKEISSLFSAISPEERIQLMSGVIKDSKLAIDNLHNVKGHLSKIVELERQHPQFDDALFLANLNEHLGRLSTAGTDMNGESFRKLAILFEAILLQCVARDRREAFSSLYHNWSEIQFLMYDFGELSASNCDPTVINGVKLRMHICTFVHLQQVSFFSFFTSIVHFYLFSSIFLYAYFQG
ncbi:MAG TPA: hypothetical protein VER35_01135 [Candidatus Limnocylindrales bacterium]|nr:hypothetical protein [Candidatus Limnocylindrales bacterium]